MQTCVCIVCVSFVGICLSCMLAFCTCVLCTLLCTLLQQHAINVSHRGSHVQVSGEEVMGTYALAQVDMANAVTTCTFHIAAFQSEEAQKPYKSPGTCDGAVHATTPTFMGVPSPAGAMASKTEEVKRIFDKRHIRVPCELLHECIVFDVQCLMWCLDSVLKSTSPNMWLQTV